MRSHLIPGVALRDDSDATSLLAVQGPKSLATLQKISSIDLSKIGYYHCTSGAVAGVEMIISRTGYTGELGFELYHAPQASEAVWNAVFAAGGEFGIAPIGLGARDTLRLEMGFCLYGNDIDQTTNPLEAGLGWITKPGKGEFIGRAAIERARAEGLKRHLVGFVLTEKAVARHGYPIRSGGEEIGAVTSGTFSPTLGKAFGMGYVTAARAAVGGTIGIDVRGQLKEATIVSLPFLTKS
jgi:aminomethyltransferase